jgi:hypothetical protein
MYSLAQAAIEIHHAALSLLTGLAPIMTPMMTSNMGRGLSG